MFALRFSAVFVPAGSASSEVLGVTTALITPSLVTVLSLPEKSTTPTACMKSPVAVAWSVPRLVSAPTLAVLAMEMPVEMALCVGLRPAA